MVEDSPEEILGELFGRRFFPDNPLGAPIEGTRKTVRSFNRAITAEFHASMYQPRNLVITCAGNIEHKKAVALAGRLFKNKASAKTDFKTKKPRSAAPIILKKNPHLEQAHLLIGTPWVMVSDKRRYAANILTGILGDGNSSRLWQTIREERGLAYSVGASESCFADTGIFNIFAACSPAKLKEVTSLCIAEMRRIKADGVTDSELRLAKDQIKASILLSLEDSTARATTLARQEVFYGQQIPVDETIRKIEAVTKEEVRSLARTFFRTEKVALAALGDIGNTRISRSDLEV
jgi:predicted Zn-dependent peptidase